jgi:hypothetical protein
MFFKLVLILFALLQLGSHKILFFGRKTTGGAFVSLHPPSYAYVVIRFVCGKYSVT